MCWRVAEEDKGMIWWWIDVVLKGEDEAIYQSTPCSATHAMVNCRDGQTL